MSEKTYTYVIIGAGLAGVSAIKGIRESDTKGPILLIGNEKDMPYDRPPFEKAVARQKDRGPDIFR